MKYCYRNESSNVEPNGYINMTLSSFDNGSDHVDPEHYPN